MKLTLQVPLPGDEELKIGATYRIKKVEPFTSQLRGFEGLRVEIDEVGGSQSLSIPLWQRDLASRRSKIGAFVIALGDDTDKWIGKQIIFEAWARGNRVIKVVG